MQDEQPPPPPPPPPSGEGEDPTSASSSHLFLSRAPSGPLRAGGRAPTFSELRAGFTSRTAGAAVPTASAPSAGFSSGLRVSTASDAAALGFSKEEDPLTPRTRREMEREMAQLKSKRMADTATTRANTSAINSTATTPTVHSSTRSTPHSQASSSFFSASASGFPPTDAPGGRRYELQMQQQQDQSAHQMSPHRALLSRVDNLMGVATGYSAASGAAAYAGSTAHTPTSAASGASSRLHRDRSAEKSEPSSCGAEILYNSLVRVRLGNHQCLRISAVSKATTKGNEKSRQSSSGLPPRPGATNGSTRATSGVQIDVSGDGLDGDDDQVFALLNGSLRSDCAEVHYSDVVALYCVAGTCRGQFLSVDPSTQSVTTKKGPVISNNEKWRLVSPVVPSETKSEEQDAFAAVTGVSALWEEQTVLMTSDRVMLKMNSAELYVSFRPHHFGQDDVEQRRPTVVLSKKNDGIDDTVQVWAVTKSNLPFEPDWNREREYLTGEALVQPQAKRQHTADDRDLNLPPLSSYPPSVQESVVIDDLLYAFLGVEGRYVKLAVTQSRVDAAKSLRTFKFGLNQPGMDPSIATLASRCLPLGEFYLQLSLYIEQYSRYEYGQVNHAFCAALKTLLKEYTIVVGQLEHQMRSAESSAGQRGAFTIQKLWYQIQPSLRTMEMLSLLVGACRKTRGGGSLLTEIQRIMSSLAGDVKARQVFAFLMERASVPYLKMVERWIYHGDLVDPYDEFMVRRDNQVSKEDVMDNPYSIYWESRYTVRASQVPLFLSRFAPKILTAGKYLNVFRTCNRQVDCPFAGAIAFSASESVYEELIDKAHGFASQTLLDLFVRENDLQNRLASLKHYFLMDQGDFFVDFMNVAEEELKMRADRLSLSRLESLLHLSLQTSTCSSDPYKDDLQCFLSPRHLILHMEAIHQRAQKGPRDSLTTFESSSIGPGYRVVDAFTLDYKVKWPLSLVISCGALTKYQMIFRHIFFCKHVERQLCDAWLSHQATKELSLRVALGRSFCLRQRMLHFQQNFVYYMMFEVISPRWHDLQQQLATVGTVDDILELQGEFLDICLKECLLTDPDLLRVLTKLMTVCMTFANSIECFTRPYFLDEETIKAEREAERDRRAEKKAREEAEAALATFQRQQGAHGGGKKRSVLRRRQSSQVDMRRARIKELSDDVKRALTEREGDEENPFVRMTKDYENKFDSLLAEFLQQLIHRSSLQHNSHLQNLCTRLDYNGFYTK